MIQNPSVTAGTLLIVEWVFTSENPRNIIPSPRTPDKAVGRVLRPRCDERRVRGVPRRDIQPWLGQHGDLSDVEVGRRADPMLCGVLCSRQCDGKPNRAVPQPAQMAASPPRHMTEAGSSA